MRRKLVVQINWYQFICLQSRTFTNVKKISTSISSRTLPSHRKSKPRININNRFSDHTFDLWIRRKPKSQNVSKHPGPPNCTYSLVIAEISGKVGKCRSGKTGIIDSNSPKSRFTTGIDEKIPLANELELGIDKSRVGNNKNHEYACIIQLVLLEWSGASVGLLDSLSKTHRLISNESPLVSPLSFAFFSSSRRKRDSPSPTP